MTHGMNGSFCGCAEKNCRSASDPVSDTTNRYKIACEERFA